MALVCGEGHRAFEQRRVDERLRQVPVQLPLVDVVFLGVQAGRAIYLALSLPGRQVSAHFDAAWAGFDVVVDAWFDVMTSPPSQLLESVLLGVAVEPPLATVCAWLSYHAEQVAERRIVLLLRHRRRVGHRSG